MRTAQLARTIARKSLVLLRNDGTLPLAPDVGSVAVIGPCADDVRNLFGDYAYPAHVESMRDVLESGPGSRLGTTLLGGSSSSAAALEAPTVLDALRERLGARVRFERGLRRQRRGTRRLRRRRRACRAARTSRSW